MGFRKQRLHHLLPSKLQGFRLLPWWDFPPQVRAALCWVCYLLMPDPVPFIVPDSSVQYPVYLRFGGPAQGDDPALAGAFHCPEARQSVSP